MKFKVITEGSIEDSYIFSMFNDNKELTTKMLTYIKGSVSIEEDMLEQQILEIKRSRISPLYEDVLGAFARGEIELLYSRAVKIPQATPFIIRRDPNFKGNTLGIRATIFIANFGIPAKKNDQMFDIPSKNLYVLMESAFVALYSYIHPSALQRSSEMMRITCSIYTTMFMRIFSREYALTLDPDLNGKVSFVISRFFLKNLWELKNPGMLFNTAASLIQNPNINDLQQLEVDYEDAEINDVSGMLLFIKTLSPRMDNLSVKYIIQRFMMTYQGGAVLAMDYLPYLFYVIINTVLGGFLVNQTTLSDIIKNNKEIRNFYPELRKLLG